MTSRKIEYWVIPPKADAVFAAAMEDVLAGYAGQRSWCEPTP